MKIFICSMPLIAAMMLVANYSFQQWDSVPLMEYDERAQAIFKSFKYHEKHKPESVMVSMLLRED